MRFALLCGLSGVHEVLMSKFNGVVVRRFGTPARLLGSALAGASAFALPVLSHAAGLGLGIGASTSKDSGAFQTTLTSTLTALAGVLILVALGILAVKWVVSIAKRG
jgi:hypothetical protein